MASRALSLTLKDAASAEQTSSKTKKKTPSSQNTSVVSVMTRAAHEINDQVKFVEFLRRFFGTSGFTSVPSPIHYSQPIVIPRTQSSKIPVIDITQAGQGSMRRIGAQPFRVQSINLAVIGVAMPADPEKFEAALDALKLIMQTRHLFSIPFNAIIFKGSIGMPQPMSSRLQDLLSMRGSETLSLRAEARRALDAPQEAPTHEEQDENFGIARLFPEKA